MSSLRAEENLRINREMVIRRIVARAPFCEDLCPANLFRCGRELHLPEEVTVVSGQVEIAISANEVLEAIESGRCTQKVHTTVGGGVQYVKIVIRLGWRKLTLRDSKGWDDVFQAAFAWQRRQQQQRPKEQQRIPCPMAKQTFRYAVVATAALTGIFFSR